MSGLLGLVSTIVLFVGGLRFRDLRSSGNAWLRAGFWFSLTSTVAVFVLQFILGMVAAGSESDAFGTSSDGAALVIFLAVIIEVAAIAFEILALTWLTRNPTLPQTS